MEIKTKKKISGEKGKRQHGKNNDEKNKNEEKIKRK